MSGSQGYLESYANELVRWVDSWVFAANNYGLLGEEGQRTAALAAKISGLSQLPKRAALHAIQAANLTGNTQLLRYKDPTYDGMQLTILPNGSFTVNLGDKGEVGQGTQVLVVDPNAGTVSKANQKITEAPSHRGVRALLTEADRQHLLDKGAQAVAAPSGLRNFVWQVKSETFCQLPEVQARVGEYTLARGLAIAADIAAAVAKVHENGYSFAGDLKAEDVELTLDPESPTGFAVKLAGVEGVVSTNYQLAVADLNALRALLSTALPNHIPPEKLNGLVHETVDKFCDILGRDITATDMAKALKALAVAFRVKSSGVQVMEEDTPATMKAAPLAPVLPPRIAPFVNRAVAPKAKAQFDFALEVVRLSRGDSEVVCAQNYLAQAQMALTGSADSAAVPEGVEAEIEGVLQALADNVIPAEVSPDSSLSLIEWLWPDEETPTAEELEAENKTKAEARVAREAVIARRAEALVRVDQIMKRLRGDDVSVAGIEFKVVP